MNDTSRTLVIRYEKMVADLFPQLVRIRDFLRLNTTDQELRCVVCLREGSYHRKKQYHSQDPWTLISPEIGKPFDDEDKRIGDLVAPYV